MKKLILLLLAITLSFSSFSKDRSRQTYEGEAIVASIDYELIDNMSDKELGRYLYKNSNMIQPIKINSQDSILTNYEKYRKEC